MIKSNIHTHTTFSDGKSTAEEYVALAIEKGFESLGFSDHSPVVVEPEHMSWVFDHHLQPDTYPDYIKEINRLKEKYKDQIEIYVGIEEDYYPVLYRPGLDFVIGAVHFLPSPTTGQYHMPDYTLEEFQQAGESFGSIENFVTAYYQRLRWVVTQAPDVLAHLDLVTKLNQEGALFDSTAGWYRSAVTAVLDTVATTDVIVEMNSGAISRGYTDTPYPADFIMKELSRRDIPIILSSDAHHVDGLDCAFDDMIAIAKDHGYRSVQVLAGGEFRSRSI